MTATGVPDYYAVLGVAPDAPTDEIQQAFRREAKFWFPDLFPRRQDGDAERCTQAFIRVREAWGILQDPDRRRAYDEIRREWHLLTTPFALVVSKAVDRNFSSISEAVASNEDNLPIIVLPGVYSETIELESSATIIGLSLGGRVVIKTDGLGIGSCNGDSSISGITLRVSEGQAISVRGSRLLVENCIIETDIGTSASVSGNSAVLRMNNSILRCKQGQGLQVFNRAKFEGNRVTVESHSADGVVVQKSAKVTLRYSSICENRMSGVNATENSTVVLENSRLSGNGQSGIALSDSCTVDIADSEIAGNGRHGIHARDSKVRIDHCQVNQNRGAGIVLEGTSSAAIDQSIITTNKAEGVIVEASSSTLITNSILKENGRAEVRSHSTENSIVNSSTILHSGINMFTSTLLSTIEVNDCHIIEVPTEDEQIQRSLFEMPVLMRNCHVYRIAQDGPRSRTDELLQDGEAHLESGDFIGALELAQVALAQSMGEAQREHATRIIRRCNFETALIEARTAQTAQEWDEATVAVHAALTWAASGRERARAQRLSRAIAFRSCLAGAHQDSHPTPETSALVAAVAASALAQGEEQRRVSSRAVRTLASAALLDHARRDAESGRWQEVLLRTDALLSVSSEPLLAAEAKHLGDKALFNLLTVRIDQLMSQGRYHEARDLASEAVDRAPSDGDRARLGDTVRQCEYQLTYRAAVLHLEHEDWARASQEARTACAHASDPDEYAAAERVATEAEHRQQRATDGKLPARSVRSPRHSTLVTLSDERATSVHQSNAEAALGDVVHSDARMDVQHANPGGSGVIHLTTETRRFLLAVVSLAILALIGYRVSLAIFQ